MSDIPPPPVLPPTFRRTARITGSETPKEELKNKIYEDYKALQHFNLIAKKNKEVSSFK